MHVGCELLAASNRNSSGAVSFCRRSEKNEIGSLPLALMVASNPCRSSVLLLGVPFVAFGANCIDLDQDLGRFIVFDLAVPVLGHAVASGCFLVLDDIAA